MSALWQSLDAGQQFIGSLIFAFVVAILVAALLGVGSD